eukprot:CAMPEP_0167791556 /NCGR_PEP_ID=MMETSP0111_2-20121227/12009_1 /TAXON_ID=91324 /ORGANISM="Lotharella globosa, Strain CCCM811" /LENGTH=317 /DNA_ID=CAMNT_0007684253 /DNA_START=51 /DNA_END=1004 /DNA_ORIENTATION=+
MSDQKSVQVYSCIATLNQFSSQLTNADTEPLKDQEVGYDEKAEEKFMMELKKYDPIINNIKFLERASDEIEKAKEDIDNVVVDDEKNKLIHNVDLKLKKARATSQKLKAQLTDKGGLKEQNEAFRKKVEGQGVEGSVEVEIKENLYNFYMKKYFLAHKRYTTLAKIFKDRVHTRQKREISYLATNLTEAQVDEIIEKGLDRQFIDSQMTGDEQELNRLMAQADDVKQINQGVREILEMFQEMAGLVDAQQETIDNITAHIGNAKSFTGEAVVELHAAAEYQLAARKKMLACCIIAVVVVIVVILAILGSAGVFDSSG